MKRGRRAAIMACCGAMLMAAGCSRPPLTNEQSRALAAAEARWKTSAVRDYWFELWPFYALAFDQCAARIEVARGRRQAGHSTRVARADRDDDRRPVPAHPRRRGERQVRDDSGELRQRPRLSDADRLPDDPRDHGRELGHRGPGIPEARPTLNGGRRGNPEIIVAERHEVMR